MRTLDLKQKITADSRTKTLSSTYSIEQSDIGYQKRKSRNQKLDPR